MHDALGRHPDDGTPKCANRRSSRTAYQSDNGPRYSARGGGATGGRVRFVFANVGPDLVVRIHVAARAQ